MARRDDEDPRERRRRREEEAEQEEAERKGQVVTALGGDESSKFNELVSRAEPLIEQVNSLYAQYIGGIEDRPPLERRKHLEEVMYALQMIHKPTPAYRFRYQTIQANFLAHRERWEKLMRDLESGKIKRRV